MITRQTVGMVLNKDTYVAGSAIYIEKGEFQFKEHENHSTLWPSKCVCYYYQ